MRMCVWCDFRLIWGSRPGIDHVTCSTAVQAVSPCRVWHRTSESRAVQVSLCRRLVLPAPPHSFPPHLPLGCWRSSSHRLRLCYPAHNVQQNTFQYELQGNRIWIIGLIGPDNKLDSIYIPEGCVSCYFSFKGSYFEFFFWWYSFGIIIL